MALTNENLYDKTLTADPTDKYFYSPDLTTDYYISYSNLFGPVNAAISALQTAVNAGVQTDYETGQSSNFTKVFAAFTKIESIDFRHISASPLVKIGTTPGGDEILPELPVPSGEHLNNYLGKSYESGQTIYISISGGSVDVAFNYRSNYFN